MNPCELASVVTALAAAMTKGKTTREINQLAVIFTQLGDTLATIAFQKELCEEQTSSNGSPPA